MVISPAARIKLRQQCMTIKENNMNLIACDGCGVVLDKNNLKFPKDIYLECGKIDTAKGEWNGDDYVPFVECPVCRERIMGKCMQYQAVWV